jgi:hypothetical protein
MTLHTDSRFDRLPKWAQAALTERGDRIIRLEEELARTRALLQEGDEEAATVILNPYSDNRRPLPDRPSVQFQFTLPGGRFKSYFLVNLDEHNRLDVHSSTGAVVIHPKTGNAFLAELTR